MSREVCATRHGDLEKGEGGREREKGKGGGMRNYPEKWEGRNGGGVLFLGKDYPAPSGAVRGSIAGGRADEAPSIQ